MLISQEPHISSVRPFVGSFLFGFSDLLITLQPSTKTYGSTNDAAAPFIFLQQYLLFFCSNTCYLSASPTISLTFIFLTTVKPPAAIIMTLQCFPHSACSLSRLFLLPRRPLADSLLLCQLTDRP